MSSNAAYYARELKIRPGRSGGSGEPGASEVVEDAGPLDRLCKDHVGARLPRARHERLAVARHHDDACAPFRRRDDLANQHVAGDVGQSEIAQNDVEMALGDELGRFAARSRCDDVRALGPQKDSEDVADVRGVFDHENA